MFQPSSDRFEQLHGPIERLRMTAASDGRFIAWVGGRELHGRIEGAFNAVHGVFALQRMARFGLPARIGVLVAADGRRQLHWAVAAGSAGLVPTPSRFERQHAFAQAMRWLPVLALWLIWSAVTLPRAYLGKGWMLLLLLALSGSAVIAWMLGTHAAKWWRQWRRREVLAESEQRLIDAIGAVRKQHRLWSRRLRDRSLRRATAAAAAHAADLADAERVETWAGGDDAVALQCLHGRLPMPHASQDLHGEGTGMLLIDDYRFALCGRYLSLRALHGPGYAVPFLAMGDRVEVWLPAREEPDVNLVYALRNLEDGRLYIAHGAFRMLASAPQALTGYTGRSYRLRGAVGAAAALLGTVLCYFVFGADPAETGRAAERGGFFALLFLAMLAAIVLPYLWSRWRWRRGRANPRERLTERLYAALGLGSPLAPLPAHVHDI
ncbi:hypothetical protein [Pseudomonas sp. CGJS7]|uniref:hypothetical protein n=1 Tax=Pseudomonas sp. CGJS7 TaxID=3109348 RepID=UPI00300B2B00